MRILYYGQILSRKRITGVERFAINQITYLSKECNADFIVISKNKVNLKLGANCKKITIPFLNHLTFLLFGKIIKKFFSCDYLVSPHSFPILFSDKKDIFTIHDVAWFYYPELFPKIKKFILQTLHLLLIRSNASLHCVSVSTMNDVKHFYGRVENIFISYPGAIYDLKSTINGESSTAEINYKLPNVKYILFIGTYQKRKNLQFLFKCIDKSKEKIYLKIVGGPGWYSDDVIKEYQSMMNKSQVEFVGYVSDEVRDFLISNCECIVLPSMYEGFGFPIIEGLKYNKVTIAAKNSSMIEIVGDANLLFNDNDVDDFERALNFVMEPSNKLYLNEYIEKQKKFFTWRNFSIKYINYLEGL